MMTKVSQFAVLVLVGSSLLLPGCKGEVVNDPVPVKGKVLSQDGGGLEGVLVRLEPLEDSNKSNFPEAQTKEGGAFELSCLKGRYKVTIAPIILGQGGTKGPQGSGSIGKGNPYLNQSTEVTIPEGGKSDLVISVKR
jgi:hypothetical protein